MADNSDRKRIEKLEQRIEYLEDINRTTAEALELAASLGNFEISMSSFESPETILRETCLRARKLLKSKAQCIFLFSEEDSDLELAYCTPRNKADSFRDELEHLVENGSLAWALDRHKPFFTSSKSKGRNVLLHSLATSSRIRGVYLALLEDDGADMPDSMRLLFSIIMQRSANSLESYALYSLVRDVNDMLEEKVQRLAASEEALKQAHDWMRAIFDVIPVGVNIVDEERRIIEISDKLLEYYNMPSRGSVLGRTCYETLKRRKTPCPECSLDRVIKRNKTVSRFSSEEETALTGRSFKIFSAPIPGGYQGHKAMAQFHLDVTDLRDMERALTQARDEAERASHAKSDFLASMSHEIRTPMNAIMGMTDIALATTLNRDQREYLEIIAESSSHLLMLINDILDFSKIEAKKLELEHLPVDLGELLDSVKRSLLPQALRKGIALELEIHEDVRPFVMADPGRLRQVLFNLVGNAIKFTSQGMVRIRLQTAKEKLDNEAWDAEWLLLSVEDTGIGVPTDKLESIFEEFSQVDSSMSRRYGGTGLGLTISKLLVSLMGGRIWVESEPDKGSTFQVLVPFEPTDENRIRERKAQREPAQLRANPGGPLEVLLAEDNAVNARVAMLFLERNGHAVTLAGNGHEALERLSQKAFDLVLMDLEMPGMDGLEAAMRIRDGEAGSEAGDVVIVAMTAHAVAGYREKCIQAGMDFFLSKPVNLAELKALLDGMEYQASHCVVEPGPPEVLDRQDALGRAAGEAAVLLEILEVFQDDIPRKIQVLREAIEQEDLRTLKRTAHAVKGASGTIGAIRCLKAAARLEKAAEGRNTPSIPVLMCDLEKELGALMETIEEIKDQMAGQAGRQGG